MCIASRIQGNNVTQAYERLAEVHNSLGAKIKYASSPRAGFLVTAPEELGAGGFVVEAEAKDNGQKLVAKAMFGASVEDAVGSIVLQLNEVK